MAELKVKFVKMGRELRCKLVLSSEDYSSPDEVRVMISNLLPSKPKDLESTLTDEKLRCFLHEEKDECVWLVVENIPGERVAGPDERLKRKLMACSEKIEQLRKEKNKLKKELIRWERGEHPERIKEREEKAKLMGEIRIKERELEELQRRIDYLALENNKLVMRIKELEEELDRARAWEELYKSRKSSERVKRPPI
jgi:DNA repair exonuclease SbcCD ATPase subunit